MRIVLILGVLLPAACGANEQTLVLDGSDRDTAVLSVADQGAKLRVQSSDGEVVHQQGALNAHFPDYAPRYPGSTVTSSTNFTGIEGSKASTLTQQTGDRPAQVMAFYKQNIAAAGLNVIMEQTTEDSITLAANKEGDSSFSVMITAVGDTSGTTISITAGQWW